MGYPQVPIKVGDRRPSIVMDLWEPGTRIPAAYTAGDTVVFAATHRETGTAIGGSATVILANSAVTRVQYDWSATDSIVAGDYDAVFKVTDSGGKQQTYPGLGYIWLRIEAQP